MRVTDRRNGLPDARGRGRYAALHALRHGHLAQAPQRAGLQDQLRDGPGEGDHGGASVATKARTGAWPSRSADRKSTRLNSSHLVISYAVFCLEKISTGNIEATPY